MSFEAYVAIGVAFLLIVAIGTVAYFKFPKRINQDKFMERWKKLQQRCADEAQWALAIVEADDLLAEALKKKRYKGKSIGERLVEAQKNFTDNDSVWFGHKLRTKLDLNPEIKLTQTDVQKALLGLRQGLKDIGALKNG
jgi:hypothetical protein